MELDSVKHVWRAASRYSGQAHCKQQNCNTTGGLWQGKAALVVVGIDSCEPGGRRVCYNEVTYFIRGSGAGFARIANSGMPACGASCYADDQDRTCG